MKGIIIEKGEEYFTLLRKIFLSMNNIQKEYNWLITGHECYPQNAEYAKMLSAKYCWLTGEELTNMIENEDFQWIWGVLSAFSKNVSKEKVLEEKFPKADGYTGFWKNPISIQHSCAEIEIVAWDGSMTILISKNDDIIDRIKNSNPMAEDLEKYNTQELE